MSSRRSSLPISAALLFAICLVPSTSAAGAREECVDAHGRGQDQRDRGQLARARQTFLACAQGSCPIIVQQDCSRFGDELAQLVPTVTFSARDASATDLPATMVYVDEVLVATRLDDGRSYELDPGKHVVRYVHEGRDTTLKVVLNQGERGRLLIATFLDRGAPRHEREAVAETTEPPSTESKRSVFPLVVAGVGVAAAVIGAALLAWGSGNIPSSCSASTNECAVAPNDPAIANAESGMRLANTGLAIGIGGVVTLIGGLVWYFAQPASTTYSRRGRTGAALITF